MELIGVPESMPDSFNIVAISDPHFGSRGFELEPLERALRKMRKKRWYGVIGGDIADCTPTDNRFFNIDTVAKGYERPLLQYTTFNEFLDKTADKILAILDGNHDWRLQKYGRFVEDLICKPNNIPYGGYMCRLIWPNLDFAVNMWHGGPTMPRGAKDPDQRLGNQRAWLKNRLQDIPTAYNAHIHMMSHTHRFIVRQPICSTRPWYQNVNGAWQLRKTYCPPEISKNEKYGHTIVPEDAAWWINTGALMSTEIQGAIGYNELYGYPMTEVGHTVIEVKNLTVKRVTQFFHRDYKDDAFLVYESMSEGREDF